MNEKVKIGDIIVLTVYMSFFFFVIVLTVYMSCMLFEKHFESEMMKCPHHNISQKC